MKSEVYDITIGEAGGNMDGIRIYNRLFTQDEITKVYNQEKLKY
jgi:hypothetical protein